MDTLLLCCCLVATCQRLTFLNKNCYFCIYPVCNLLSYIFNKCNMFILTLDQTIISAVQHSDNDKSRNRINWSWVKVFTLKISVSMFEVIFEINGRK